MRVPTGTESASQDEGPPGTESAQDEGSKMFSYEMEKHINVVRTLELCLVTQ